ncbi:MAG: hypothetical protein K0R09_1220 [Clostridiales bacterium]|nr:hypothetical protein [Clostridiales bacterium]
MKKSCFRNQGILLVLILIFLASACDKTTHTNTNVKGFVNLSEESIYSDSIVKTIEELSKSTREDWQEAMETN